MYSRDATMVRGKANHSQLYERVGIIIGSGAEVIGNNRRLLRQVKVLLTLPLRRRAHEEARILMLLLLLLMAAGLGLPRFVFLSSSSILRGPCNKRAVSVNLVSLGLGQVRHDR